MGLRDSLVQEIAKHTADSIGQYVNSGIFNTPEEALKVWCLIRRNNGLDLTMIVDQMADCRISPGGDRIADAAAIAESLFYEEMNIDRLDLSRDVRNDIEKIFKEVLG